MRQPPPITAKGPTKVKETLIGRVKAVIGRDPINIRLR
jgi:hypothetical protein